MRYFRGVAAIFFFIMRTNIPQINIARVKNEVTSLPPLSTLLAFEAVARRQSFALAASELNLTASAVSHQIARLEELVGHRLIDRLVGGVKPSKVGEQYLRQIAGALGAITSATQDIRAGVSKRLYVHASPSLASLWLMPRLADFAHRYPEVSLFLSASPVHSHFASGQSDIDIRYGLPVWPKLKVLPLFQERVLPLICPNLARQLNMQNKIELLQAPLIQSTVSLIQWSDWFLAQGLEQAPERFALRFDRAQLSLDAAVQGLGIALESATMAAAHIEAKRLIPLFDASDAITIQGHFAVYPEEHAKRDEVALFLQWLQEQAEKTQDAI